MNFELVRNVRHKLNTITSKNEHKTDFTFLSRIKLKILTCFTFVVGFQNVLRQTKVVEWQSLFLQETQLNSSQKARALC